MDTKKLATVVEEATKKNSHAKPDARDVGQWLRASVPALRGPFAGDNWVKYVLRVLIEAGYCA